MLPGSIWQDVHERRAPRRREQFSPFVPLGTPLGVGSDESDKSDDVGLRRREVRRRGQGRRRLRPQQRRLGPRIRQLGRLRPSSGDSGSRGDIRKRLRQLREEFRDDNAVFEEPQIDVPGFRSSNAPVTRTSGQQPAGRRRGMSPPAGPGDVAAGRPGHPHLDRTGRGHGQPGHRRPAWVCTPSSGAAGSGPRCGRCCCSPSPSWRSAGSARRRACSSTTRPTDPPWTGATTASTWRCATPTPCRSTASRARRRAACRTATRGCRTRARRTEQVRYMEYPVLTGFFQYGNARLAAGWLELVAQQPWLPDGVAGGRLLHLHRVLAGARLARRRVGGVPLRPSRPWDAALVACHRWSRCTPSPTSTRWPSRSPPPRCSPSPAAGRGSPACCSGSAAAVKLYPLILLVPLVLLGVRRRDPGPAGARGRRPRC